MKKEIEITASEINCFFSAIVRIMLYDEKWQTLNTAKKSEVIQTATKNFITNFYEEEVGLQSYADVIYFLLKDIGYDEKTTGSRWCEVLRNQPIEDAVVHFNLHAINTIS